jgi:hypothetical protein
MPVTRAASRSRIGRRLVAPVAWLLTFTPLTAAHAQSADADAVGFGDSGQRDPAAHSANADTVGFGDSSQRDPAAHSANADTVGFGDSTPLEPAVSGEADRSAFSAGGRVRLRGALWLGRLAERPLAQARGLLGLWVGYSHDFELGTTSGSLRLMAAGRGDYDFAYRIDRVALDAPTIETYEWQVLPDESYATLALGSFELSTGWLKMQLGQGEVLRSLWLNPRDLRDPGLTDPEELVLPVLATRAGLELGRHGFDVFVVHEAYFGLRAPPLGWLSPLRALILRNPATGPRLGDRDFRYREAPDRFDPAATQVLGRYRYRGDGLDLELYAGSVLDPLGYVQFPSAVELERDDDYFGVYHARYTKLAHAGSVTLGSMLLRWELALDLARPLSVRDTQSAYLRLEMERHAQLNTLLGLTYFGIPDLNFGVELQRADVFGNPERRPGSQRALLLPVESVQLAFRFKYSFWRERLQLSGLVLVIGITDFNAAIFTGDLRVELADGLWLAAGGVAYLSNAHFGPVYGFERNDRVYLDLRWDFALF